MNLGTKSGMRFMEPNLGPDIILLDKRVAFFFFFFWDKNNIL